MNYNLYLKLFFIIFLSIFINSCSKKTPIRTIKKSIKNIYISKKDIYISLEEISKKYLHLEDISNLQNFSKTLLTEYIENDNSSNYLYNPKFENIIPHSLILYTNNTMNVEDKTTKSDLIEKKAKKLLGKKYLWGATGPNKFDCSGFTQCIYNKIGIKIPRVSKNQAKIGEYIPFNKLKKGDLIFFEGSKEKEGQVSHVGIYLGHNNFIHASSKAKEVIISNFKKNPFYKKRFLWGRKIIKNSL